MASVQIRNKRAHSYFVEQYDGQMTLDFDHLPKREVYWLVAETETKKRLVGHKVVTKLMLDPDTSWPTSKNIDSDDISELRDPKLRYALRFADAADAVGWIEDGPYTKSGHHVTIVATDNGVDSLLLYACYTGVVNKKQDTFMQSLHAAAPVHIGQV